MIILEKIKGKAYIKPANLFFIELLIVLVFFGFSSAVILQLFASADNRQRNSDLTEKTLICAQSVAEAFSVSGSLSDTVKLVFGEDNSYTGNAVLTLDDDMKAVDSGAIILELTERNDSNEAGRLSYLDMKFIKNEKEVYTLSCSAYIPVNGGEADE